VNGGGQPRVARNEYDIQHLAPLEQLYPDRHKTQARGVV